ncbi:MAG: MarR family transcriptional regulator [Solirubrobacterales bacterium]|nr:MarR family transcriptional regulator [Solirubrobacterales bacterium]
MSRDSADSQAGGRIGRAGSAKPTKAELVEQLGNEFRINQNRSQVFDDIAAEHLGINQTDHRCLDIVQRLGGATAGELAREAGLTTGGVTAVVDRLERIGYARRTRDERDRRRVLIEVTPEFHERAWRIWEPLANAWQRQSRHLTRDQLELLLRFLREGDAILDEQIERLRALRDGSE